MPPRRNKQPRRGSQRPKPAKQVSVESLLFPPQAFPYLKIDRENREKLNSFLHDLGYDPTKLLPPGCLTFSQERRPPAPTEPGYAPPFPYDIFLLSDELRVIGFRKYAVHAVLNYLFGMSGAVQFYGRAVEENPDMRAESRRRGQRSFENHMTLARDRALYLLTTLLPPREIPKCLGGKKDVPVAAAQPAKAPAPRPKLKEDRGHPVSPGVLQSEPVQRILRTGLVREDTLNFLLKAARDTDVAYRTALASVYSYRRGRVDDDGSVQSLIECEGSVMAACFDKFSRLRADDPRAAQFASVFFPRDVEVWMVRCRMSGFPEAPRLVARFHLQRRTEFREIDAPDSPLPLARDQAGGRAVMWKPHRRLAGPYPFSPPLFELKTEPDGFFASEALAVLYKQLARVLVTTDPAAQPVLQAALLLQGDELVAPLKRENTALAARGRSIFGEGAPPGIEDLPAFRTGRAAARKPPLPPPPRAAKHLSDLRSETHFPLATSTFSVDAGPNLTVRPEAIEGLHATFALIESKRGFKLQIPEFERTEWENERRRATEVKAIDAREAEAIRKDFSVFLRAEERWRDATQKRASAAAGKARPAPRRGLGALGAPSAARTAPPRISKKIREKLRAEFEEQTSSENALKILPQRQRLPVWGHRDAVVAAVRSEQVVVISGSTGCGKSTQIPQFLLDDLLTNPTDPNPTIVVTQPRRVPAISLATRVSDERGEAQVGGSVGYQIRLETRVSKRTRLKYCTVGVLLRKLFGDPLLRDITCLVVDEVHERDINADFLLIFLKSLLRHRADFKLVLMSATLDTDMFSRYFGAAPILEIPGFTHPVVVTPLETILELTAYELEADSPFRKPTDELFTEQERERRKARARRKRGAAIVVPTKVSQLNTDDGQDDYWLEDGCSSEFALLRRQFPPGTDEAAIQTIIDMKEKIVNTDLAVLLIDHICGVNEAGNLREGLDGRVDTGAILVFLPGMGEIKAMKEALEQRGRYGNPREFWILPCHSSLPTAQQSMIFRHPPAGCRKIILSTNITETSVTVDDVTVVIDFGLCRRTEYRASRGLAALRLAWVSKASANQRAGRAGRTQPGRCFRLYSSLKFESLPEHEIPEMRRAPLHSLYLQVLALGEGDPSEFLLRAPQPPAAKAVAKAQQELIETGLVALAPAERGGADERPELTSLGCVVARLPLHPRVGRLLVFGAALGCFDAVLTIAAALSVRDVFAPPFGCQNRCMQGKRQLAPHGMPSDHLAMLGAYNGWRRAHGRGDARGFIRKFFLSYTSLCEIRALKKQLAEILRDAGLVAAPAGRHGPRFGRGALDATASWPHVNDHNEDPKMVLFALAAGLYPQVARNDGRAGGKLFQLRTARRRELFAHPTSLLIARPVAGDLVLYQEISKTTKTFCRGLTIASPLALCVFARRLAASYQARTVTADGWITLAVDPGTAAALKLLRRAFQERIADFVGSGGAAMLGDLRSFGTLFASLLKPWLETR
eukprot:gnl/Chilomastix_cuspidata/3272.p1 GENE.gnl/Chilomastix_cuspidata/3272~~gnl/Chilomastix_cuspidata/3272.p1  ORF type:complete len:1486 (+),score=522.22 gnl/Chilomastix_cuspidata/3272:35-4492(+)